MTVDASEVAKERAEQGLPPTVTDPSVLARIAALVRARPVTTAAPEEAA